MIDFLAMDLVVVGIGLLLVAWYFVKYVENDSQKVAPGFLMIGSLVGLSGLDIIFRWPLVSSYNIVFGEPITMLGFLFFFAGLAFLKGWDLHTLGVYAVLTGIVAIILGVRIWHGIEVTNSAGAKVLKGMTSEPPLAGLSFILTGIGAILTLATYIWRKSLVLRWVTAIVLVVAAVLFGFTGYGAYWAHPQSFAAYKPHF